MTGAPATGGTAPRATAEAFLAALHRGEDPSAAVRTIVVGAHPDDETVGLGAQLARLTAVRLVTVTDGAPRNLHDAKACGFGDAESYAAARFQELRDAMALAGIGPDRMETLGLPDQQVSLRLAALARQLAGRLEGAGIVITHPYEGGHPDHDGTAFAVHAARVLLMRDGRAAPEIVEATFYHAPDHGAGDGIATGRFLPGGAEPTSFELSGDERDLKQRMFAAFRTQRETLAWFSVDRELLRPAPRYHFTAAPHDGNIFYDRFDWGMRGERWRMLAAAALEELDLAEPL